MDRYCRFKAVCCLLHQQQESLNGCIQLVCLLFGRSGLLKVPHLECVILGGGDQDGLHRVKGQSANPVKMATQSEFGVPCFSHGIFIVANLRGRDQIRNPTTNYMCFYL